MMNEKQFHKLDKIVLHQDELEIISEWVRSQNFNTIDIPLNECFVIINGIHNPLLKMSFDMGIHFKIDDDNISVSNYDMSDMFKMVSANIGEKFFTDGEIDIKVGSNTFNKLGDEYLNRLAKVTVLMVFDIFQYMTNKEENVIENKVKKTLKNTKKSSKSGKKRSKYVKIHSKRYNFDVNAKNNVKKYERYTESWTVRGHWRYYKKSGKRVWIDGYVKGKGQVEGKVYKI